MAKIGLLKGSGKRVKVREKSVKSQGILKWILSGNPAPVLFEVGIWCVDSSWMAEWCIPSWVTLTFTLTSDLISRFFLSGAYLLSSNVSYAKPMPPEGSRHVTFFGMSIWQL